MVEKTGGGLCFIKNSVKQETTVLPASNKCVTCNAIFKDVAAQKAHYKSELHLYNLKRKGNGINPVTSEEYIEIKNRLMQMISVKNNDVPGKSKVMYNKLNSRNSANGGGESKGRNNSDHSETWPPKATATSLPYNPMMCIFSGKKSDSVEENVKWMEKAYSFFIPEKAYVSDMESLLSYLYDLIYDKYTCIYCAKPFKSVYAVLHHMEQKQHRKLDDDALDELRQFYDFTRSYLELIPSNVHASCITDASEDDEWEDIVTTQTDSNSAIQNLASFGLTKAKINESGHLTLPNGREAVHRAVSYVYKQHLVVRWNYGTSGAPAGFKFLKKDIKKQLVRGEKAKRNHLERGRYNVQYKSYKLFVPCNQIAFAT